LRLKKICARISPPGKRIQKNASKAKRALQRD
jgi:hypothetical protein